MRQAILKAYSGPAWADKVKQMPDGQVFAVYKNLKAKNRI